MQYKTVRELYEGHPERWSHTVSQKGRFSLFEALSHVYTLDSTAFNIAYDKINKVFDSYGITPSSIALYNDRIDMTFDQILALVIEAGI